MALQGSLTQLRLGEVLQTVLQAGHTGSFHVRSGGRRAVVHVGESGLRLLEPVAVDEQTVLDVFVQRGLVSPAAAERAREEAGPSGFPVEVLVAGGELDRRLQQQIVLEAVEDVLLDALAWQEGDFRFEEGPAPEATPGSSAAVVLEPSALLLRAAQRQDEVRRVEERIGRNAALAQRVVGFDPARVAALDPIERRVFGRLDGRTLLEEAALQEGLTLFAVRRAVASLIEAGLVALPSPQDLSARAAEREGAGDLRSALALLRQWQGLAPSDPVPFEAAVAAAHAAGRTDDELDALSALGGACLKADQPQAARAAFDRVLRRRPGERAAVEGLREAARRLDDADAFARATQELALAALEGNDPARADALLGELIERQPDLVPPRVLHVRALVRTGAREAAVAQIEQVVRLLPSRCRRRPDREAASYCRETVAHLAPDRADLLRALKGMVGEGTGRRRRAVIVGALLLAVAGAGVVFWPSGPGPLLRQALDAASSGRAGDAVELATLIEAQHPGTPEAAEAAALRQRLMGPRRTAPAATPKETQAVLDAADEVRDGLPRWPQSAAVARGESFATLLRTPAGAQPAVRKQAAERLREPFADAVAALRREALARRDAVESAAQWATRPPTTADAETLREVVDRALAAVDPEWASAAQRAAAAARRIASLLPELAVAGEVLADVRAVEADVEAASRSMTRRSDEVAEARRELLRLQVIAAYERARADGIKDLVRGDLDAAQAHYDRLGALLSQARSDEALRPLLDAFEKRGIVEFVQARTSLMMTIRDAIRAAQEAERTDNLAGAASTYASLAQQYPSIRFDAVFTIPLRVVTVPADAEVAVNGRPAERRGGAAVVRYGWGAAATLTASAPGYEPASVVLRTSDGKPQAEVRIGLVPRRRWAEPLPGPVEAPPLVVGGDVVVCTRTGRAQCYDGATGGSRWSADLRSLEGVRGRPVATGGRLWVPLLDGRVARVDAASGALLDALPLSARPAGDAAAVGSRVAIALERSVAVYPESGPASHADLGAPLTVGVLAAHGAFWVGDASGTLSRIDPATTTVQAQRLCPEVSLVGLATGAQVVYALASDGTLFAVDPKPGGAVAWKRPGLGDVVGHPAEAAGEVLVAERGGRVRRLSAPTGAPLGELSLGAAPHRGLVAMGSRVAATLADGRLWLYAPGTGVLADASLAGNARIPPVALADGTIVAPGRGAGLVALGAVRTEPEVVER